MAGVTGHVHDGAGGMPVDWILAAPFAVAFAVYMVAATIEGHRGRGWPWYRSVFWAVGMVAAASGFVGPLAAAAHSSFTAHMASHLLVGMVAPLFLVLSAPVTLALRTMSIVPARRLSRMLRSPAGVLLTHPVVAVILSIGGMWTLYTTPLYQLAQQVILVHLVVMVHFLVAGYLFTFAIVGVDPSPHRTGFALRALVLVASLAAHGVLAKLLYADPLPGVVAADAYAGAQLMFYGGDAVDFVLIVLLCAQWYRATGRRLHTVAAAAST